MAKAPKYLDGLNARQTYAATSPVTSLAIVAGPGTGKTRTIASRVVHLVEGFGVHPSKIVAFTFTRSAAHELKERVEKMGGPDLALVTVSTFHAYALRLVRVDPAAVQAPTEFTVARESDAALALGSLFEGPMKRPEAAKVSRGTFKDALGELYATGRMPEGRSVQALINTYLGRLADFGLVPAGMLLPMALRVLDKSEAARALAAETTHVLVDEAHDSSPAEAELFRRLAAGEPRGPGRLTFVLDPRQAIFGWRGALGGDILKGFGAGESSIEEEIVELSRTYRFGPEIAALADRLAELGAPGFEAMRSDPVAPPGAVTSLSWAGLEDHLRDTVKTYGAGNVAVLVRSRHEARQVADAHRDLVDNVHAQDATPSWLETAEAMAALIVNPADNTAFRRLYELEEPTLSGRPRFEKWASRVGRSRSLVAEYIAGLRDEEAGEQGSLLWEVTQPGAVAETFDVLAKLAVEFDYRDKTDPPDPETIVRPVLDSIGLSGLGVADALDRLSLRSDVDTFGAIAERGRTPVSTVHAAKGREWDAVLVVTSEWPWTLTKDGRKAEEWRVMFVAATRAKRELVVCSHPNSDTSGVLP